MTTAFTLSLLGLICGLLGSLLLANSLSRLVRAIVLAINALDTSLQAFAGKGDVPIFTGLEKHFERGIVYSKKYTVIGFVLLAISFGVQVAALLS